MMTRQTPIQKFEALAQQLIEGSFSRFLGSDLTLSAIAAELSRVVENEATAGVAPCQYEIHIHPTAFDKIVKAEPDAVVQLTDYLRMFVRQAELSLAGSPYLTLVGDPEIAPRALSVAAVETERPSTQPLTQIRQPGDAAELFAADIAALDAYLIVDGQRHVPLTKPVTNLGRNIENDVVLDAPTVSRQHAQIRWRYGRFILYDVSNRGRTQVNNQTVSETVLKSGDVISLSDVKLIYGEGETQPRPRPRSATDLPDETQIRPPSDS